jgi:arabinogalactan endo-1,4-beta-galactosidase
MKTLNVLGVIVFLLMFTTRASGQFAKGADVSWASQMENAGVRFYNASGTQQDLFLILKNKGMNTIRLRVWLNPWEGWCGKEDVITKAIRAKNAGFRIMIDFHYSDSWADPGQQTKPAAWSKYTFTNLTTAVYNHTVDVLNSLKANGITPEWVQVGNETNDGLLWEDGRASSNMRNYALLINAGYDAVKAVSPATKVIVHVSNGWDNGLFRWNFDGLKNNGGKWDVIGMSLYPTRSNWQTLNNQCLSNMKDMVARYGKQVMIVEVGMEARQATDCKSFLIDLMNKTASLANGNGLGVLYWEPQTYNRWQGYTKGAFDEKGKPTIALDAFLTVAATSTPSSEIISDASASSSENLGQRTLNLYPNPSSDVINIHIPAFAAEGGNITVYNYLGQKIIDESVKGSTMTLDVSLIQSGRYWIKIRREKMAADGSFIKN